MRHQVPGLHAGHQEFDNHLDGLFLVRVVRGWYRWHPKKPFVELQFVVVEPQAFQDRRLSGRLYCTERAMWKLYWFLRDFGYDADLLHREQIDERALMDLRGVVRTSHKVFNGQAYQNLDAFAPAGDWEALSCGSIEDLEEQGEQGDSNGL
jgi:hypothetical protein